MISCLSVVVVLVTQHYESNHYQMAPFIIVANDGCLPWLLLHVLATRVRKPHQKELQPSLYTTINVLARSTSL